MVIRRSTAALALPPVPASAAEARTFVRSRLDEMSVPEPPLEDAVLLVSELVTNALLHAGTDVEIRLDTDEVRVRVEVHDGDSRHPAPRVAEPYGTHGRGLLLVERVANDWGIDRADPGKSVWFELAITIA